MGWGSLGLTDINNSSALVDFVRICREHNLRPMAGIDFFDGKHRRLYTGLAHNNKGFRELNEFLSQYNFSGLPLPFRPPEFENACIVYPSGRTPSGKLRANEYTGINTRDIRRIISSQYRHDQSKLVIRHPVTYRVADDPFLHQNLRAIDRNILISRLKPEDIAGPHEFMLTEKQLMHVYGGYPEIIRNTRELTERCSIDFDFQPARNKRTFTGSETEDRLLLEKLTLDGMVYRYGQNNREAGERVKRELDIIFRMGFAAYFLITWDIIRYSMSRGFYHVGRGSGANSVVAYCLRITDVDPIELDLYFERFINPRRSSPPDFDIDYSWTDREQVQAYIFKRYGRQHTALLGAMSTFRGRSIYRELGKVYGLPGNEIDLLIRYPGSHVNNHAIAHRIHTLAKRMVGFPNIRSIHAGGIIISEEPITNFTALDLPPKGFPTTQWDMYTAGDIGFEKLDILSQRGIGHIRDCAGIIRNNQKIHVDVHQVDRFKNDHKVKKLLEAGETNGCFYVESPAMRGLLKKLRCRDYRTLVAASSIIRPGVARSGMMKEYIRRHHYPDDFTYIHPVMEKQLKETYGVMVYQEDVLRVCHHFAGLDLADSDVLRRAMSGKFRGKKEFERIVRKFFRNCKERNHPDAITREVWRQIESFAGYSFSKAHSASYAVESFQSLYLKAHYPLEFMVAVINNFGGFFGPGVYFNEAKRWGGRIQLPCVNHSEYKTTIRGKDIFPGFVHLRNLDRKLADRIVHERKASGAFESLGNFLDRVPAGIEQVVILIRMGAFRFTGRSKAHLLWEAHLILGKRKKTVPGPSLFRSTVRNYRLPQMEDNILENAYDEIELLGFPLSMSYFDMLEKQGGGWVTAKSLPYSAGKNIEIDGWLITTKYVRTIKNEIMHFAAFLDRNGDFFDTVHFPASLQRYPFRGDGVYRVRGVVVEEYGFPSIEARELVKLPLKNDPRSK